jgi:Protein of unknown function (DUF3237)
MSLPGRPEGEYRRTQPEGTPVTPPTLEFAFEIRAQIGAVQRTGPGPLGERQHIPIVGGTVAGPRLNGRILPGGSDWPLTRADGNTLIEAHYSVRADDGTLIYVHNRGLRVSSADVLERLRRGETVPAHEMYFRSAPVFDAPEGVHGWLTRHLFVATLERAIDKVRIRVFVLL